MQLKLFFFLVRCIKLKYLTIFYKLICEYWFFISVEMKAAHCSSRQAFIAFCQVLGCKTGADYKWIPFWVLDKDLFVLRIQKVQGKRIAKLPHSFPLLRCLLCFLKTGAHLITLGGWNSLSILKRSLEGQLHPQSSAWRTNIRRNPYKSCSVPSAERLLIGTGCHIWCRSWGKERKRREIVTEVCVSCARCHRNKPLINFTDSFCRCKFNEVVIILGLSCFVGLVGLVRCRFDHHIMVGHAELISAGTQVATHAFIWGELPRAPLPATYHLISLIREALQFMSLENKKHISLWQNGWVRREQQCLHLLSGSFFGQVCQHGTFTGRKLALCLFSLKQFCKTGGEQCRSSSTMRP